METVTKWAWAYFKCPECGKVFARMVVMPIPYNAVQMYPPCTRCGSKAELQLVSNR